MASFLVAVGLLAVFALLRRGIDTEGVSESEVHETLFAETALATLRAAADHAAATNGWNSFWKSFNSGDSDAHLPLPGAFADPQRLNGDDDPSPFLMGSPNGEWHAALFSGWPTGVGDAMAVSNTVWYCITNSVASSFAHVQIHIRADRPRETSRTAFTIIPNQTGRSFWEIRREDTPSETPVEDD